MRIPGYCDTCGRIKQVHVSGHGMAMLAARQVAHGICADCEEGEKFRPGVRVRHRETGQVGRVLTNGGVRIGVMWDAGEDGEPDRSYAYPRQLTTLRP
jgi:hypothetical protein